MFAKMITLCLSRPPPPICTNTSQLELYLPVLFWWHHFNHPSNPHDWDIFSRTINLTNNHSSWPSELITDRVYSSPTSAFI